MKLLNNKIELQYNKKNDIFNGNSCTLEASKNKSNHITFACLRTF